MIWKRTRRRPIKDVRIMSTLFPAADAAALADGVSEGGAEYLLLAALDLEDGSGRRAFERVGADPDAFSDAVRAQHADALRGMGVSSVADDILDQYLPEPRPARGPVASGASAHAMFRAVVKQVRKERSQLYSAYFVVNLEAMPIVLAPPAPTYRRCLAFRYTAGLALASVLVGLVSPTLAAAAYIAAFVSAITISAADDLDEFRFHRGLLFVSSVLSLTVIAREILTSRPGF